MRDNCAQIKPTFFSISKLLVVVLGPVSVGELVSVQNAPSTPLRSAPGLREISSQAYGFWFDGKLI